MKSTFRRYSGWMLLLILGFVTKSNAQEADDLLGNAAWLSEPNLVALLELTDEQQTTLGDWTGDRIEKAMALLEDTNSDLPEGQAAIQSFIDESETQAWGVLEADQQELFKVVKQAQLGFAGLKEAEIRGLLKLTSEQSDAIETLLKDHAAELEADPAISVNALNGKYALRVKKVFTPSQLAAWRLVSLEVPGEMPEIVPPESAASPTSDTAESTPKIDDSIKITFSFGQMDWEPLIEWFAEQAELSLQLETTLPDGTFAYQDKREYTVAQSIDLLNNVLMLKGVTLVRNNQQLLVVDLEEIPEQLIPSIGPEELDIRGKYEIVSCVFSLEFARADDLQPEIRDLVNEDYGSVTAIQLANQLVIRETVGNLRTIREIVGDAEARAEAQKRPVESLELEYITADEAMVLVRSLFNIEDEGTQDEDGTIWIAPDSIGLRLYYRGEEDRVEQLLQLIQIADKKPDEVEESPDDVFSLESYTVRANPEMVLKVLQTLLANLHPDIRVEIAAETNAIVLYGRPADHAKAMETIEQLQGNAIDFGVVDLRDYDPDEVTQMLVDAGMIADPLSLDDTEFFGPKVVVDPLRNRLVIRGTKLQVEEVRAFIEGIDPPRASAGGTRSNARLIPLQGAEADDAMRRIETLWQTKQRKNRLNFKVIGDERPRMQRRDLPGSDGTREATPDTRRSTAEDPEADPAAANHALKKNWQFVTVQMPSQEPVSAASQEESETDQVPGADIFIEKTPYGLIIRSEDVDALDDLEDLIRETVVPGEIIPIPTVFYLRNRSASEAQDLLSEMLGLSSSSGGGGGGLGGMLGGLAGNMIGGPAGDIVGGMLGGGGGGLTGGGSTGMFLETTGDIGMVADPKLNALIVQANDEDLGLIEELLEFIDQEEPPVPPELEGKTRVIPVRYQDATEVLNIVKEQLGDFIKSSGGGGQGGGQNQQAQQQQQILQALLGQRGGRGGRGGGGGGGAQIEPVKIAVSVETKTSSLVVTGPRYLQDRVEDIVFQLDRPEIQARESIDIIQLKGNINPELLRDGLQAALLAEESGSSGGAGQRPGGTTGGGSAADDARRAAIQQFFQRGGGAQFGGGGRPGGTGGGRGGAGGGGRGGRGGR